MLKGLLTGKEIKRRKKSNSMLTVTDTRFSSKFYQVLSYHLSSGARILDPTCGKKYIWKKYFKEQRGRHLFPFPSYVIVFADEREVEDCIVSRFQELSFHEEFDAVVFDPPYLFGLDNSADIREEDYGRYSNSFFDIEQLIEDANTFFPTMLKTGGLLFFKCSDVFSMSERKFYYCAYLWVSKLSNFVVKDMHIIIYHNISGTAWQVKNRPCSIVNYTYLFVLEKRKKCY